MLLNHVDELAGGPCQQCASLSGGKEHSHRPAQCEAKDCQRLAHSQVCQMCGKYHPYGRVHYRDTTIAACEVHNAANAR